MAIRISIRWLMKLLILFFKKRKYFKGGISKPSMGCKEDLTDCRDYHVGEPLDIELPKEVDLRNYIVEVKSQGKYNACVSYTITSSIELQLMLKNPHRYIQLSEVYNYYYGRKLSKTFPNNTGMYPKDGIKSAKQDGITIEALHNTYKEINEEPGMIAKSIAHIYGSTINQYYRVYDVEEIKQQLSIGLPVIVSVPIYDYWEVATGKIRKPLKDDKYLGLHAMLCVGYNERGLILLNSWSKFWGDKGYCYLPYDYEMIDKWVLEIN